MPNIYQKMAAITAELKTVSKNLTVQQSRNSSYKAVSERDVLDAVKPLEEKYGVYSYPVDREILESNLLENETSFTDAKTGDVQVTKKTTFMTRIKTVYRFVNIDDPKDYIDTITFAEGIDAQDKGSGKAMTYADKYALMKGYKISTGEDPDQTASEEKAYTKQAPAKTPREKLIAKLNEKGIDATAYAKEKGLSAKTTPERFNELLKELEGKNNVK